MLPSRLTLLIKPLHLLQEFWIVGKYPQWELIPCVNRQWTRNFSPEFAECSFVWDVSVLQQLQFKIDVRKRVKQTTMKTLSWLLLEPEKGSELVMKGKKIEKKINRVLSHIQDVYSLCYRKTNFFIEVDKAQLYMTQ